MGRTQFIAHFESGFLINSRVNRFQASGSGSAGLGEAEALPRGVPDGDIVTRGVRRP